MWASGLRTSTPEGRSMSLAVTSPGPVTTSGASISVASECMRQTTPLRLRTMSVTSSLTPLMVENSCATPSILTLVTAAPASEESSPPPQRVAERVAEAAVERFDDERAAVLLHVLGGDAGDLEIEHGVLLSGSSAACDPAAFWGAYLEYSSMMSCSCTGAAISRRSGLRSTLAVSASWSACNHGGT